MPQAKNKKKGKGGKGHKGGKGGKQHKQHQNKHNQNKNKNAQHQHQNKKNNKKEQINHKQQQAIIRSRMIDSIDSMYIQYTQKHGNMRTFFGIFTKHNQSQLRVVMKASIPNINEKITDKCLKQTQLDENRDINQFIFLGDVVIGAYATELHNNNKDCLIKAICVLPYFRNYGFGSRLLVNLIKNGVKRKKLVTISLFIDEENKKGIAFFERFGFKIMNQENESKPNGVKKGDKKKKREMKQEVENNECKTKNIKMRLDLRIYRSSIMVLVKKQLQAEATVAEKKDTNT